MKNTMNFSKELKSAIKTSTHEYIKKNDFANSCFNNYESAIVFKNHPESNIHFNFHNDSFHEILKKEDWAKRLDKLHTHFGDGTKELASSNSSDALLMNIFCHPKILKWKGTANKLGFTDSNPIFGHKPGIEDHNYPTEIDMLLGNTFYEAKLTESDFTTKDLQTIEMVYPNMKNVFDLSFLTDGQTVRHYQLLRNIFAAHVKKKSFVLLVDFRRPDLLQAFIEVLKSIKDYELLKKCNFITWQEITKTVGKDLKDFLQLKYGF